MRFYKSKSWHRVRTQQALHSHLLSNYCVAGTVLDPRIQGEQSPCPPVAHILVSKDRCNQGHGVAGDSRCCEKGTAGQGWGAEWSEASIL